MKIKHIKNSLGKDIFLCGKKEVSKRIYNLLRNQFDIQQAGSDFDKIRELFQKNKMKKKKKKKKKKCSIQSYFDELEKVLQRNWIAIWNEFPYNLNELDELIAQLFKIKYFVNEDELIAQFKTKCKYFVYNDYDYEKLILSCNILKKLIDKKLMEWISNDDNNLNTWNNRIMNAIVTRIGDLKPENLDDFTDEIFEIKYIEKKTKKSIVKELKKWKSRNDNNLCAWTNALKLQNWMKRLFTSLSKDELNKRLHSAVSNRNTHEVKTLLDDGANPNHPEKYHYNPYGMLTPLHLAASKDNSDIVKLLIQYGANPDAICIKYGTTPLMFAAYYKFKQNALILILANANIYLETSIDSGVIRPGLDATQIAKEKNCDWNDNFWNINHHLLKYTYEGDHNKLGLVLKLYEKHRKQKILQLIQGEKLLGEAIEHNHIDIVRLFIEHGVKINVYNINPPLHLAISKCFYPIIKLLIDKEADLDKENEYYETPLEIAQFNQDQLSELYIYTKQDEDETLQDRLVIGAKFGYDTAVENALDQLRKNKLLDNSDKNEIIKDAVKNAIQSGHYETAKYIGGDALFCKMLYEIDSTKYLQQISNDLGETYRTYLDRFNNILPNTPILMHSLYSRFGSFDFMEIYHLNYKYKRQIILSLEQITVERYQKQYQNALPSPSDSKFVDSKLTYMKVLQEARLLDPSTLMFEPTDNFSDYTNWINRIEFNSDKYIIKTSHGGANNCVKKISSKEYLLNDFFLENNCPGKFIGIIIQKINKNFNLPHKSKHGYKIEHRCFCKEGRVMWIFNGNNILYINSEIFISIYKHYYSEFSSDFRLDYVHPDLEQRPHIIDQIRFTCLEAYSSIMKYVEGTVFRFDLVWHDDMNRYIVNEIENINSAGGLFRLIIRSFLIDPLLFNHFKEYLDKLLPAATHDLIPEGESTKFFNENSRHLNMIDVKYLEYLNHINLKRALIGFDVN